MCGISGHCSFNGSRIARDVVRAVNDELKHRGPDDEGYYFDAHGRCTLGHRRLSIIDLATGHQPIFNEDETVAIVFNGEVYNFMDLRKDLEGRGHRFKSNTDTEVILHLYEEYGINCIKMLRGMFAFALWDSVRGRLLLARDRVGKKPLYYSIVNETLYFASEIQALYKIPCLKRDLNYHSIDLFLTYSYIPSPHTIYKDIRKLPPAHYLCFDQASLEIGNYWKPDFRRKLSISYEEAREELIRILTESVKIRLISDVPLGVFLSGGLDSSTIVAIMSQQSRKPVKTFSIGFNDKKYNEIPYARMVARRYKTEHQELIVEPNALEILPGIIRHYGEPYGDSSALPTWYLSEMTRQHVTVALNGDGGDELFGGYPWYNVSHLFNKLSLAIGPRFARSISEYGNRFLPRRVRRTVELLSITEKQRFQSLRSFMNEEYRSRLYHDNFRRELVSHPEDYIYQYYDETLGSDYDRAYQTDILSYLPEDLLVKVDRASMAHSLECRSPLLDQELLEFSCALPAGWKNNGRTKSIFKDAIKVFFDSDFIDRRKMGFSVPIGDWFKKELKPLIEKKVIDGPLTRIRILNKGALGDLIYDHFQGRRNHETMIWNFLMLSLWFEEYELGGSAT